MVELNLSGRDPNALPPSFFLLGSLAPGNVLLRKFRIMHLFSQYLRMYYVKGPGDQPQIKQTQASFSQNLMRSGLLTQLVNMSVSDSGTMCFKGEAWGMQTIRTDLAYGQEGIFEWRLLRRGLKRAGFWIWMRWKA